MEEPVGGPILARVNNAILWSATAHRLLRSGSTSADLFGELQLGLVAAYLSIQYTVQLVDGAHGVDGDALAREQCPVDLRTLRAWETRLSMVRSAILHLGDKEPGRQKWGIRVRSNPRGVILTAMVGRWEGREERITVAEVTALLDELYSWQEAHWGRFVQEERDRQAGRMPR